MINSMPLKHKRNRRSKKKNIQLSEYGENENATEMKENQQHMWRMNQSATQQSDKMWINTIEIYSLFFVCFLHK